MVDCCAVQAGAQADSNGNQAFGPLEGGNSAIFGGSGGSFGGSGGGLGSGGGGLGGGLGGSFSSAPLENGNTSVPALVGPYASTHTLWLLW